MPDAQVNGATLFYESGGRGPAVVLIHEGIVDLRMWESLIPDLERRFQVIRYDQRGFGRSSRPDGPYSDVADLLALLDVLGVEQAALVGGSKGGSIAINFTLAHPGRVWALVPIASGLSGFSISPYSPEQEAAWEAAYEAKDWKGCADVDMEVWAPLGAGDGVGELVYANAAIAEVEDLAQPPDRPAAEHLDEIAVPTLVVTGDRDVPDMDRIGDVLVSGIRGARRARIAGADHVVPMRRPAEVAAVLVPFLEDAQPGRD